MTASSSNSILASSSCSAITDNSPAFRSCLTSSGEYLWMIKNLSRPVVASSCWSNTISPFTILVFFGPLAIACLALAMLKH